MRTFDEKFDLKKRRSITGLQIFCVMVSCFFYWSLTKSIIPLLTCLVVYIPILFRGVYLKLGTRSIVYTMVSAMVLSVIPYQFVKQTNVFFMLPGNFLVPFCIVGAAHLCLLEQKRIILSGFSTFIFLCYLIGGDLNTGRGVLATNNTNILGLKWSYLISLALCLVALFTIFKLYGMSKFVQKNQQGTKKWQARIICLVAFVMVFICSPVLQKSSVPVLRHVENYLLSQLSTMGRYQNRMQKRYENENNISRPIHNKFGRNLGAIVMRVSSERAPRLLRFYAYDTYEGGIWSRELDSKASVREEDNEDEKVELLVIENYILNKEKYDDVQSKTTIYPTNFLSDKIIPLSYDSVGVSVSLDSIDAYPDNSLEAKGLSQSTGIRLLRSGKENDRPISKPTIMSREYKKTYSFVPENLRKYLNVRWQDMSSVTHDPKEAAQNIVQYFNNNYSYDLNFVDTYYEEEMYAYEDEYISKDIIEYFLSSDSKSGHCELFATSTVLLLRSAGFQARYACGSTVTEQSSDGDYMITRAKDLHAWVEVWDNKSKKWFVVDPTPSRGGFFKDYRPTGLNAFIENMTFKAQKIFSYVLQGEITVALAAAFFAVYEPVSEFLKVPLNAVVTLLLIIVLVIWRISYLRKRNKAKIKTLSKELIKAKMMILAVAKKHLLRPSQGSHDYMNIAEICRGFEQRGVLAVVIDEIRLYEKCRFGSLSYTKIHLSELKSHLKLIPKMIKAQARK
ncbi:transglutaminase-like domain-containing protein [Lentisphaera profundi]|uniref:Transglutaminase-like domain-containing protein n=1 Tax=Lentisphaera profundi TaxID=1658616 RepID=A0ABY7VYC0_9BACT|nr:transglutaminase-like domain-containing protein [Lentisphaera profundi]WDE98273.1 transglutaminase-like domain-containing protein [Lentisphaera profundi]